MMSGSRPHECHERVACSRMVARRDVQALLRSEFEATTLLTIAHRLGTVIDYHSILAMAAGKVRPQHATDGCVRSCRPPAHALTGLDPRGMTPPVHAFTQVREHGPPAELLEVPGGMLAELAAALGDSEREGLKARAREAAAARAAAAGEEVPRAPTVEEVEAAAVRATVRVERL